MSRTADPHARIALLRAAEEIFAAKGLSAAKVEEITQRAGTSKGAFYLHFESKEEALRQVVEAFLARCGSTLKRPDEIDPMPTTAAEILAFWNEHEVEMLEFLWQNRAILRILNGCQGPHVYLIETFRDDVRRNTEAWIEVWKKRGFVRANVSTEIVAALLVGAYHELVSRMLVSDKKPPIVAWVKEAQSLFVQGLGTSPFVHALERRPKS